MRKLVWVGLLALFATVVRPSHVAAQERTLPEGLIPADTLVVASLDLNQIDPQAILDQIVGDPKNAQAEPASQMALLSIQAGLQTFRDSGASEILVVVPGSAVLHGGVCIVVPCQEVDRVATFFEGLANMDFGPLKFQVVKRDDAVVFCPQRVVAKFDGTETAGELRSDITRAWSMVSELPHRLIISAPKDLANELGEVWPGSLQADLGVNVSPKQMAQDIRSIGIQWRLPPEPELRITFMGSESGDAARVAEQLNQLLSAASLPLPGVEPRVDGSNVMLDVDTAAIDRIINGVFRAQVQASNTMRNLKMLGLAMHNYHDAYGHLPQDIRDEEGNVLLSWRVAVLPFLDEGALYERFKLDEPWDSPHNVALVAEMPLLFNSDGNQSAGPGKTTLRMPVYPDSMWDGEEAKSFRDIRDGLSNTIAYVDAPAAAAVTWTKPRGWNLPAGEPKASFFGDRASTLCTWGDGSVRAISNATAEAVIIKLLTSAGREAVGNDEIK